jgi:hypothetical protein
LANADSRPPARDYEQTGTAPPASLYGHGLARARQGALLDKTQLKECDGRLVGFRFGAAPEGLLPLCAKAQSFESINAAKAFIKAHEIELASRAAHESSCLRPLEEYNLKPIWHLLQQVEELAHNRIAEANRFQKFEASILKEPNAWTHGRQRKGLSVTFAPEDRPPQLRGLRAGLTRCISNLKSDTPRLTLTR